MVENGAYGSPTKPASANKNLRPFFLEQATGGEVAFKINVRLRFLRVAGSNREPKPPNAGGFATLTFPSAARKTPHMDSFAPNFYAAWRENCRAVSALRENGAPPPEKLLQAVWQQQRLHRDRLQTGDGRSVRVFHPGFISTEGGPDFRGAVIQIGDAPAVSGDVEIDLHGGGWRAHGHDRNPNFKNVILHVVWEDAGVHAPAGSSTGSAANLNSEFQRPTAVLPLKNSLDAPLAELALALEHDSGLPEYLRGKCSAPLRELNAGQLAELLHAAALVRLENKAKAMRTRAQAAGWEQALWEQLFRALGYKSNVWPMQNLAETRARWMPTATSVFALQARLLGVSGLLPDELTPSQKSADSFLRRTWDVWWRDRDGFQDCALPRAVWKFHGLRPVNHPQRRLALAAHWLVAGKLTAKIEEWCAATVADKNLVATLHKIFQVERDDYWSWHWTFKSARLAKPQPLLGEARVTDLAVNVVLPWLWMRAREGGNETIRREMERRFLAWPAAEDNAVLKLARQRLLGASHPRGLKGAAQQQGLMQIVRDFCEHSNAICADCRFPELVQSLKLKAQSQT
jgi:hypothetical protein